MARILTPEMLREAITLTKPSALAILKNPKAIWGPKRVAGLVKGPGIEEPVKIVFEIKEPWNLSKWGKKDKYWKIAMAKLAVVERLHMSTTIVLATMPWMLQSGEFLYIGGVYENGISVAFSGGRGWADEAIGKHLLANIIMLAHLEAERRIEAGEEKI